MKVVDDVVVHHGILGLFVLEIVASALKFVEEVLRFEGRLPDTPHTILAKRLVVPVGVVVWGRGFDASPTYRYAMPVALHCNL